MKRLLTTLFLVSILSANLVAKNKLPYIGMSLIIPGSGEIVLGKTNRGATILAWDIVNIAGFINSQNEMVSLSKSYKQYAASYAGVLPGQNDHYYQRLQDYFSSSDFNTIQELLARNYYLIYNYDPESYEQYVAANTYTGDETWQWDSNEHWKKYKVIRRDHQKAKMNSNLFLGVLILNRVASALDVSFIKVNNDKLLGSVYFEPTKHDGIMLNYQLEF